MVQEYLSATLGHSALSEQWLSPEESRVIFAALSRQEELNRKYQKGERRVWTAADIGEAGTARVTRPWLDDMLAECRRRQSGTALPRPRWPDNKRFALCLTHDMDHVTRFTGVESRRRLGRLGRQSISHPPELVRLMVKACRDTLSTWWRRDLLKNVDHFGNVGQWLRIEADCGFRSSLYFFAHATGPWHPHDCNYAFRDPVKFEGKNANVGRMMKEIATRGWEVSLHGSIASATQPGILLRQKQEIEAITGQTAVTTRQHYLQYDPARTPALQSEAGFLADGTQGFNDLLGYRAGTCLPYRAWDWSTNRALPMFEFPLHIQDGALFRSTATVSEALDLCGRMLDQVEAVGGCLGLLFHPAWLSTERGIAVYRELLQEAHRRGAWGCSMRDAAHWWRDYLAGIPGEPANSNR